MTRQDAENTVTAFLKPVYGFALRRCRSREDAEDLCQEIILRAFRGLLRRDDIADPRRFLWTVARNALANYYRDAVPSSLGVPLEELRETLADPRSAASDLEDRDAVLRLRSEIAYLSKLQRQIVVAYYFENRRQQEIASRLGIPLGTVKWHLFEAKKELKRGMDTMRNTSELSFHPVQFTNFGINGSAGTTPPESYFRSALSQNIAYCVRDTARTPGEIGAFLGVSPVYVESEAEFLEENGFLREEKGKYIANFIIYEPTAESARLQDRMYKAASAPFAEELAKELLKSGLLSDPDLECAYKNDINFLLWALVPYVAALSGKALLDERVTFDEAATLRPDGGHNIFSASVLPEGAAFPEDCLPMLHWCGPMWNAWDGNILWQIDSQWSGRTDGLFMYEEESRRVLTLYARDELSIDDYAWLAERGLVRTNGGTASWKAVILRTPSLRDRLLAIGDRLKEKFYPEWQRLKAPYREAELAATPPHLRKITEFQLQYVFHADGWFLLHCIHALLTSGTLREPSEEQRRALITLIVPE